MGEIHELFVWALSMVWFAGATPDKRTNGSVFAHVYVRKVLVSVKFLSAILGPEMAAPILWTPGKMRPLCRKNHVRKIPPFRGGVGGGGILGFWGGGGKCRFYFYGREDFSEYGRGSRKNKQTSLVARRA